MVDILASCPLISIADSGADKTSRRHRVGGSLETVPGSPGLGRFTTGFLGPKARCKSGRVVSAKVLCSTLWIGAQDMPIAIGGK